MAVTEASRNTRLVLDIDDHVARLTINRPDKRNALDQVMWLELAARIDAAVANDAVRVIVISGAGADFSAGADITEFDTVRRDAETARAYEEANSTAFAAIRRAPVPTIAAIRGVCFGGGFGIAAACDLRLATEDAQFSVPAARLGLAYPHDAMEDIVHACGPQIAKYLTYSGTRIGAADALRIGFLAEICAAEALDDRIAEIATQIASAAPMSVRASKAAIRAVLSGEATDSLIARELGAATFDSSDYQEGRAAFREKRTPIFRGR